METHVLFNRKALSKTAREIREAERQNPPKEKEKTKNDISL